MYLQFDVANVINESSIATLVDCFYMRVRQDDILGPVFAEKIGSDWEPHLETMRSFWSSLMLASGRYKGNPMVKHLLLAPRISSAHFERWLGIWKQTTAELFPPEAAAIFMRKAESMADRLIETIDRHHASLAVSN
ncbi:group III truncated hemoglobin [Alloacidobacterium dinghuense]|uniref:Group III truncated hemoglobin n=1 Tax=Alloacidobacterium dinghuense TaxID=2763107 RepID=A0A7G8BIL3_9BACT|nr:group III truncated hemoglobin [Alloacidobacterium dinghuense]QNI32383.1 group III truncated hemoglobin [Alloacidobacterium dinghuense]